MTPSTMKTALALSGVGALLLVSGCGPSAQGGTGGEDPDTLVFGALPYEDSTSVEQHFRPIVDLIAAETGKEVQFENVADYAGLIEGQRAGTIHIAMYGPTSYVLAKDSGVDIEVAGIQIQDPDGDPSYHSYIITAKDSGIEELSDLRGRNVCFVEPTSTSGSLYPTAGLTDAGLTPDDYNVRYTGGHDASALAVRDGDCDAGAIQDVMFDEILPRQGEIDPDDFTKIWVSAPVASSPLAISTGLGTELRETIKTAVLERGNADALDVDDIAGFWGFVPGDDTSFDSIRDVCSKTDSEICRDH